MPLKKTSAATLTAVGLFALTSCGSVLQSDDVEETIASDLEDAGYTEDEFDVDCSGDIDAEVDEQMTCTVEWEDGAAAESYRIAITEVEDEDVYYDIVPEELAEEELGGQDED